MISSPSKISFMRSSPLALTSNKYVLPWTDPVLLSWLRPPQALNFLWPFKLSNPTGGWRAHKFKHYVQGGDFGNQETDINMLIQHELHFVL
jgi:hypothetical protein